MVASAVFILDLKGKVNLLCVACLFLQDGKFHSGHWTEAHLSQKVLISRNYRGDIPMTAIEGFLPLLLTAEDDEDVTVTPVVSSEDGVNFLYIRHNNLYRASLLELT